MNISTFLAFILIMFIVISFGTTINEFYIQNDPKLFELKSIVDDLFNNNDYKFEGYLEPLNNKNILKNLDLYKDNKSYTINKEKIFLCLKDENNQYYNNNMLIYVLLHEISHVICDEIGHTEKFHLIFDQMLDYAISKGVYNPSIPIVNNYCENHYKI
jgi:hypothetical protein